MFHVCPTFQELLLSDVDEDGNTALMLAVESGKYNFVYFMIKKGRCLNTSKPMPCTFNNESIQYSQPFRLLCHMYKSSSDDCCKHIEKRTCTSFIL